MCTYYNRTCIMQGDALFDNLLTKQTYSPADINYVIGHFITGKKPPFILFYAISREFAITELHKRPWTSHSPFADPFKHLAQAEIAPEGKLTYLKSVKFNLFQQAKGLTDYWIRSCKLCSLDDPQFIQFIAQMLYSDALQSDKDGRIEFLEFLSNFHYEAYTLNQILQYIWEEERQLDSDQFLSTQLSDQKLIKIKQILIDCKGANYNKDKHYLEPTSDENWLYIFGRRFLSKPSPLKWLGSNQELMSTMQLICGKGKTIKPIIRNFFNKTDLPPADNRRLPQPLADKIRQVIESSK